MSDDLISRKAIMSHIESEYRQWDEDYDTEQILGDIEDFPTAYGVDKVMNMLKERAEHAEIKAAEYDEEGDIIMMRIYDTKAEAYKNAIKIVDSVGVVDEVEKQSTSYDTDKVIKQLKKLKTYKLNMADAMSEIMSRDKVGTYVCLEDVLEIVKFSAVSDE